MSNSTQYADRQMIADGLRLWFQPGDVFEIRVLNAMTAGYMPPHTESGYFDYEHIPEAAEAIGKIRYFTGAYATVNPVNPDLLARACNRIRAVKNDPTTSDTDIAERRWLLIDCDPERVSGVSSSDAEHDAALAKARALRDGLAPIGWPEPVMLDSGNGAQMMYRVDLPAADGGLVQRCLNGIATAGDDQVKVDTTVYNPARIWRIPGTMNRKGDDIPSRPHRMARILSVPEKIEAATAELLETAATWKIEEPHAENPVEHNQPFDLDAWIRRYCPELGAPQVWKDGRKWVFPVCPFNDAHRNHSAVLIQQANGAISFKCHHNGCAGNDWRKLRELREPDCYESKTETAAPVDLTGILNRGPVTMAVDAGTPVSSASVIAESIPFPADLFHVPGFIGSVMDLSMNYAPFPNKPLAFAGAIALQAHLAARKVQSPTGLRTNPYIIALAKSGVGKDFPRTINQRILELVQRDDELIENVASGQGLEDELLVHPAALWQSDEFYSVLQEVVLDTSGQKQTLMKYLLTLFTSANKNIQTRVKSGRVKAKIACPNLTLYATTTPAGFFDSLSPRLMNDGMYARLDVIIGESRGEGQVKGEPDIPSEIEDKARAWANFRPQGSGDLDVKAMTVPYTPEAAVLAERLRRDETEMYRKSEREEDIDWKLSVWSRACENALRYALVYSCSIADKPENTVITADAIRWAKKFMWWEVENKIYMTDRHYFKTEFERCSESVLEIMAKWHRLKGCDTPMPGWMFNRKTKHLSPKVLAAVQQSLILQERLEVSGKANGTVYSLRPEKSR